MKAKRLEKLFQCMQNKNMAFCLMRITASHYIQPSAILKRNPNTVFINTSIQLANHVAAEQRRKPRHYGTRASVNAHVKYQKREKCNLGDCDCVMVLESRQAAWTN